MFTLPNIPKVIVSDAKKIQLLNTESQGFNYDSSAWGHSSRIMSTLPECTDCLDKFNGKISRGDVIAMARETVKSPTPYNCQKFFFSVMLWGWSDQHIGIPRTNNIYVYNTQADIARNINNAISNIQKGDLLNTYSQFDVAYCKASFMSKMFYFLGAAINPELTPVILDAKVITKLHQMGIDVSQFINGKINPKTGGYEISGDTKGSAQKYVNYVTTICAWAKLIESKPDSLEMYLFN